MMQNLEIASALSEVADLLEIQGANPFRIRAYRNAARTVNDLTRSLSEMMDSEEDLTELPGIGNDMAGHIRELLTTGKLGTLEALGREIPRTLVHLIRLDGLGPKKAKRLWEELGITSVDDLETAVADGLVEGLAGFGRKSADRIARSVRDFRASQGRFLLSEADVLVRPLVDFLREIPGVERVEVAGSYRRRQETVGDIDVLVLSDGNAGGIMERFVAYPGASRIEASGDTKGRIALRSGLPVDLRILPSRSYGSALHYFSGSKEHNVAVRTLGSRMGLKINEYGVFSEEGPEGRGETRLGGEEEEDVFRAVGLPWIPPLLRENRGEIEAGLEGGRPRLLRTGEIRGDLQMHSTWSDGTHSIREMAEACRDRGYEYCAITDHSRSMTVARGLTPERVREQWEEIEEVRRAVRGIHLFRSLEVDILRDGTLDMPDEILEGLDLVLVSVHTFMTLPIAEMTDRVIRAMEHPEVDILAHPTGRILNRRPPFPMDVDAILQAAAALDVAVELNAHPSRLDLNDLHLRRAKELGVKVVVSTDAHSVSDLWLMGYGVDQAGRGWLEAGDVLNALSLEEFQLWRARRTGS
jgi:DNA polymerase (family 10)